MKSSTFNSRLNALAVTAVALGMAGTPALAGDLPLLTEYAGSFRDADEPCRVKDFEPFELYLSLGERQAVLEFAEALRDAVTPFAFVCRGDVRDVEGGVKGARVKTELALRRHRRGANGASYEVEESELMHSRDRSDRDGGWELEFDSEALAKLLAEAQASKSDDEFLVGVRATFTNRKGATSAAFQCLQQAQYQSGAGAPR